MSERDRLTPIDLRTQCRRPMALGNLGVLTVEEMDAVPAAIAVRNVWGVGKRIAPKRFSTASISISRTGSPGSRMPSQARNVMISRSQQFIMSTDKPKPPATKASPSAGAAGAAAVGPTPAAARSGGASEKSPPLDDANGPSAKGGGVSPARHEGHLLQMLGQILEVDIADVSARLPEMIQSAAAGRTHLIRSGTGVDAPLAVLIGVSEFRRVLREPTEPAPSGRTMGKLLASLPYWGMNLPALRAEPLEHDGLPQARLPK